MAQRRGCLFPLGLPFFGLTQQYRVNLFTQIHEIVFHGKGGFDYDTVYDFPIWLRNFTFKKMNDYYEEESKASKKGTPAKSMPKGPAIRKPSYSTKARK